MHIGLYERFYDFIGVISLYVCFYFSFILFVYLKRFCVTQIEIDSMSQSYRVQAPNWKSDLFLTRQVSQHTMRVSI